MISDYLLSLSFTGTESQVTKLVKDEQITPKRKSPRSLSLSRSRMKAEAAQAAATSPEGKPSQPGTVSQSLPSVSTSAGNKQTVTSETLTVDPQTSRHCSSGNQSSVSKPVSANNTQSVPYRAKGLRPTRTSTMAQSNSVSVKDDSTGKASDTRKVDKVTAGNTKSTDSLLSSGRGDSLLSLGRGQTKKLEPTEKVNFC